MKPKRLFLVGLWLALAVANTGALNANMRSSFSRLMESKRLARQNLALSIGFSLLPPTWVGTLFISGFYMDGWTLSSAPLPCTEPHPEIWCDGNTPRNSP